MMDGNEGLGKPKWMRKITLKNTARMALAPHTLLMPKKARDKFERNITLKNGAKAAFAPHTLLLRNNKRHRPRTRRGLGEIYGEEIGLGKSRFLRKISLKNALKVGKTLAPIAAGFIPIGGGAASGILSKVLKNKNGGASFIGRVAEQATTLSKTTAGKAVVNVIKNRPRKQLTPANQITPAGVVTSTTARTAVKNEEPVGELTPVQEVYSTKTQDPDVEKAAKDNTMLYALGGVGVLGVIYLATKKS